MTLTNIARRVVRVAHLLIGIVAMVVAARLALFIHSSAPRRRQVKADAA